MKLERQDDNYGGGSGKELFESDVFRVVVWRHHAATSTTVKSKLHHDLELRFDGKQELLTDAACMEQFDCQEILEMIEFQKKESFDEGEQNKARQIRECLKI